MTQSDEFEMPLKNEDGNKVYLLIDKKDGFFSIWSDKKYLKFDNMKLSSLDLRYLNDICVIKKGFKYWISFFDKKSHKTFQFKCPNKVSANKLKDTMSSFKLSLGSPPPIVKEDTEINTNGCDNNIKNDIKINIKSEHSQANLNYVDPNIVFQHQMLQMLYMYQMDPSLFQQTENTQFQIDPNIFQQMDPNLLQNFHNQMYQMDPSIYQIQENYQGDEESNLHPTHNQQQLGYDERPISPKKKPLKIKERRPSKDLLNNLDPLPLLKASATLDPLKFLNLEMDILGIKMEDEKDMIEETSNLPRINKDLFRDLFIPLDKEDKQIYGEDDDLHEYDNQNHFHIQHNSNHNQHFHHNKNQQEQGKEFWKNYNLDHSYIDVPKANKHIFFRKDQEVEEEEGEEEENEPTGFHYKDEDHFDINDQLDSDDRLFRTTCPVLPPWFGDVENWLNEDERLIQEISHVYLRSHNAIVYSKKVPNSVLRYFKVVAHIRGATMDDMRSLLDIDAGERQKEWHYLLVEGGEVKKYNDFVNVLYFAYKSPVPLVKTRDCCYTKVRRDLPRGKNGEDQGFLLSYRTIDGPYRPEYERTLFKSAHYILPDKINGGIWYTFIQYADPGGLVPKFSLNMTQAKIMAQETVGIQNIFASVRN
eukprot:TRINITY_DN6995_c0_g1_i1.p1 TRINITY_DN6995_c0_g1~~TRINITY_DN6995_c0_g1_i1.p1  ORF type:complete len:645 (+),score=174.25 TRINITY_DN6995_c0_g1_i1:80-2014(+)